MPRSQWGVCELLVGVLRGRGASLAMARVVEICVDSTGSLTGALAGQADRLELCSDLSVGGLTPTPGQQVVYLVVRLATSQ